MDTKFHGDRKACADVSNQLIFGFMMLQNKNNQVSKLFRKKSEKVSLDQINFIAIS